MPTLKDIRRRIDSVRKTQQITRAMRMVAGAKLRRAQNTIEAARPYAEKIRNVIAHLALASAEYQHPWMVERDISWPSSGSWTVFTERKFLRW